MTYNEALQRFGLPAAHTDRNEIRRLLTEETERAKRWEEREEMLRTLCMQLFSLGIEEDSLLIWEAKRSNFDAGCGLDIQFLCGAGLPETKSFLAASSIPAAADALSNLTNCEKSGDFVDFSPTAYVARYRQYYGLECLD